LEFLDGAVAIVVRGRATALEVPRLRRSVLDEVAQTDASAVVLSLSDVETMDSAGAAVLVEAVELCHRRHLKVLVCSSSPNVVRMFRLAGLEDVLQDCCGSPAETKARLLETRGSSAPQRGER